MPVDHANKGPGTRNKALDDFQLMYKHLEPALEEDEYVISMPSDSNSQVSQDITSEKSDLGQAGKALGPNI